MKGSGFTLSFPAGNQGDSSARARGRGRVAAAGAAWLAVLGLLGACAAVPDAVNPVEWYKGAADWWGGEDETAPEVAEAVAKEPPGADQSFPTLADVPEKPAAVTTVEERRRLMEGLAGDREHARYSDQVGEERASTLFPRSGPGSAVPSAPSPSKGLAIPAPPAPSAPPPSRELAAPPRPTPPPPISTAPPPTAPPPSALGVGEEPPPLAQLEPPPPPPAPRTAPRGPVAAEATGPAAAAAGPPAVDEVYRAKLGESAPTVTTAPVGPTADVGAAPAVTEPAPEQMAALAELPGPRSLEEFDPSRAAFSAQVATVAFRHGSAALSSEGRKALREVARMHKERGGTVRVIGHASSRTRNMDPVRHQVANFAMSVRRADAVARELMRLGIKPERIFVGAKSDSEPIYYESMPAGEAGNRRTEIFIDY